MVICAGKGGRLSTGECKMEYRKLGDRASLPLLLTALSGVGAVADEELSVPRPGQGPSRCRLLMSTLASKAL